MEFLRDRQEVAQMAQLHAVTHITNVSTLLENVLDTQLL
jgi:flagellar hook assembly protein FlgD